MDDARPAHVPASETPASTSPASVGVVAIGRNEGDRLIRCLASCVAQSSVVVYVDSGSTDGSVNAAKRLGATVVELDCSIPFTMARGRNAGFARLRAIGPLPEFVQFIDGDCSLETGWLGKGLAAIAADQTVGLVAGNRNEFAPRATIYNELAQMEWRGRPGYVSYTGGDMLVRTKAFEAVEGFNESLIAGEDPELGVRMRLAGWKLLRIDEPMTRHDIAMSRFSQWWKRSVRSGFAYAEGAHMHGSGPTRHWVRETKSNWLWGACIPLAILLVSWPTYGWSFAALSLYPMQSLRIAQRQRREWHDSWRSALLYGASVMLGKFPSALGQATFWFRRFRGRSARLIEYKAPTTLTQPQ